MCAKSQSKLIAHIQNIHISELTPSDYLQQIMPEFIPTDDAHLHSF